MAIATIPTYDPSKIPTVTDQANFHDHATYGWTFFATEMVPNFNSAVTAMNAALSGAETIVGAVTVVGEVAAHASWNWVINGDFSVNQRGASSKAQSVGAYGYDRWKGHAGGLEQVVESLPAGEYTLTWSGGGSGTFGGTTAASPIKATVTAGNASVVVPDTATNVSLVLGDHTAADPFAARAPAIEEMLCQRYFHKTASSIGAQGVALPGQLIDISVFYNFPVAMRANPTIGAGVSYSDQGNLPTPSFADQSRFGVSFRFTTWPSVASPAKASGFWMAGITFDAEL